MATERAFRVPLIVAFFLLLLINMARWGGTARPGPLFVAGIALLAIMVMALGLLIWWLYLSPLPPGSYQPRVRPRGVRQGIALLALLTGFSFLTGGFWDEVWHRRFGGFGDDFLWPPHLMIYASIAMIALFAGGGMVLALRGSQGGLRERFRTEPVLGLLGLISAYMLLSLPSDELWHRIYGLDITAWSLPHLLIIVGFGLVMMGAVAVQLSLVPRSAWQGPWGLRGEEVLGLLGVTCLLSAMLQIGTAEWEGITSVEMLTASNGTFKDAFWARPEWLYPVVIVTIATFCGTFALHALRRAGVATMVGLFTLSFRLLCLLFFEGWRVEVGMSFVPHLLVLPALIALDLWYATRLEQPESNATLIGGSLLATLSFMIVALPLLSRLVLYPRVTSETLPPMIGVGLVMALAAAWTGARLGSWFGALERPEAQLQEKIEQPAYMLLRP